MHLPDSLKHDPFIGHLLAAIAEVYAKLGPGLLVDAYREALSMELRPTGIPFQIKPRLQAFYHALPVEGYFFIPDLTIANRFLVEVRTEDSRRAKDIRRYMKTYLKMSAFTQGFILDFDAPSLGSVAEYMTIERSQTLLGG